jgi:protein-disulfide isomerase
MLTAPAPRLTLDPERALGSPDATIFIVEFADYQCPYCRQFHQQTFDAVKRTYIDTGVVRYFYKDFPLENHAQAIPAAMAARCAGEQGRGNYWQLQQRLFEEQKRLGEPLYKELARELKLDQASFDACRQNLAIRRAILRDRAEGSATGVDATPTFILGRILNDRIVVDRVAKGAPVFDVFAKEIDALRAER